MKTEYIYFTNKMCEKRVESVLSDSLKSFNQKFVYYSPSENEKLKDLFKNASKKENSLSIGIPDRIYFDNNILIIFECKATNINKAIEDLKIYKRKMITCLQKEKIFLVAFTLNNYIIYDYNFNKIEKKL